MIRPLLFIAVLSAFVIPACKPVPAVVSASGQLKEGNLKEALKMAQEGLKKHPTDNELWKLLIHVHLAMGNVTEAVAAYRLNEKSLGHNRRMSAYLGLTVLRWALTHRDPEVRQEGIQGIRSSDAAPLLKDMLQRLNDPNEVVRTWAAVALSRMPQGADILDEQLRSTSARARALALEWVARIAGEKALKAVGAAAADRAAGVREAAARALTRTGAGGLEPLLKLLKDKERTVRAAAAEALGRQDQQRARKALAAALDDSYVGVRLAAARSLGTLKDSASKPALFKLASGDDLITALAAAKALFKLGEVQPVLDAIARSLEVGKVPARVAACNAAVVVNDRVAGQLAAKGLGDGVGEVRMAAARAVRARGDSEAAVKTARAMMTEACMAKKMDAEALCLSAVELLAQEEVKEGRNELDRLCTGGREASTRQQALAAHLRLGAKHEVVVAALEDKDPKVVLKAAAWLYKKYK